MFNIKKLNNISDVIYEKLHASRFSVSADIAPEEADAIILRSADCHSLSLEGDLKCFARAGIGVNNIPIDRCTEKGIVVFNTPGANANAVKELVLCGLLLGSRDIVGGIEWTMGLKDNGPEIVGQVEKGKNRFVGPELKGKTIGVIGLGAIGVLVANMASDLGMKVIGYDPYISIENAWHLSDHVEHALTLDALLDESDYITIHVPLMDSTRNYLDAQHFEKMKDGVVMLNYSRNGLVNEEAVLNALDSGKVARYVTDFPDENILGHKNVICLPHLGGSTPEAEENCASMAAEEIKYYLEVGGIINSVNFPVCRIAPTKNVRITLIHKNVPGVIASISSIFSRNHINVEEMVNKSRGDIAYSVFDINTDLSCELYQELRALEGMIRVRKI